MNASINRLCCEFEEEIRARRSPQIESYLGNEGVVDGDRDELLEELIRVECELLREGGESPQLSAYLSRFPARPAVVRRAFAAEDDTPDEEDATLPYVPPSEDPARLPTIAGYRIIRVIGRGGMGIVYEAEALERGQTCALKMILAGSFADAATSNRFLAEARITAELDHPGVVRVQRIGNGDGALYLEMEYLGGGTLADRLDGTPWKPMVAARLIRTLADAISYAHGRGVVHRDLKPGNILFTGTGQPKITDFGLAKTLGEERGLTLTFEIFGSPGYMAPEQARGESKSVGPGADIYALGVILYELLTGRPPFKAPTIEETLEQVKRNDPVPPSRLQPGIPRDLETICLRCLQKEPERRFAAAVALAEDLDRFREGAPIRSRRATMVNRAWRWCRRNPLPASLLGALGAILVSVSIASVIAAESFRRSYATVKSQEEEIVRQKEEYRERSVQAWLSEAAALRMSRRIGQRFESLKLIDRAAHESLSTNVRDQAIAALALPDLRPIREWSARPSDTLLLAFDPSLQRYARLGHDGTIAICPTGDRKPAFRLKGRPIAEGEGLLLFSPNGRFLATATGPDSPLAVWDLDRREDPPRGLGPIAGRALAFSPDGHFLAFARPDLSLGWLSLDGSEPPPSGPPLPGLPEAIAFHPDGSRLAILGPREAPAIEIRSVRDGSSPRKIAVSDGYSLAWSPDGGVLAIGGTDGDIHLQDAATLEPLAHLPGSFYQRIRVEFSPDDELLLAAGDLGRAELWDWRSRRFLLTFPIDHWDAVAFRNDGQRLAFLDPKGDAIISEIATGRECQGFPADEGEVSGRVRGMTIHPDGRLLALATDARVRLLDSTTGEVLASLPERDARSIAFDAAGRLICATHRGVRRWSFREEQGATRVVGPPEILPLAPGEVGIACSRDGSVIATGRGHRAEVWVDRGGDGKTLSIGLDQEIRSLDVSPDGRWLVTCSHDQRAPRVWEIHASGRARELGEGPFTAARFSPDGRWLAGSGETTARIWRVGDWEAEREIPGQFLAFSPGGEVVAAMRGPGIIRIEDLTRKEAEGMTLEDPDGRGGGLAAFAPDGTRFFVAGGPTREVIAWDFVAIRGRLGPLGLSWDLPIPRPLSAPSLPIRARPPARIIVQDAQAP